MEGKYMRLQKADFRRGVTLLIAFVLALMVVVVPNTTRATADQATSQDSNMPVTSVRWTDKRTFNTKYRLVYKNGWKNSPSLTQMGQKESKFGAFWAWCIDYLTLGTNKYEYRPDPINTESVKISAEQYAKIAWIVEHGYNPEMKTDSLARLRRETGHTNINIEMAVTATQAAIWRIANDEKFVRIEASPLFTEVWKAERDAMEAIYNYLVDGAESVTYKPINYNVGLTPKEIRGVAGEKIGAYVVHLHEARPGSTITLQTTKSGVVLVKDGQEWPAGQEVEVSDGDEVYVKVPSGTEAGDATLLLKGTAPVPAVTTYGSYGGNGGTVTISGRIGQPHISINKSKPVPQQVTARAVWEEGAQPEIETTASVRDGDVLPVTGGTIVDDVAYSGLRENQTYTLRGELMVETGESTGISKEQEFIAEGESTAVNGKNHTFMEFDVPAEVAQKYRGKNLVVFETVYLNGQEVAFHRDLTSKKQTVRVEKPVPKIGTQASVPGTADDILPREGGKIVDKVSYEGLEDGVLYFLEGKLVRKEISDDGTEKVIDTGITNNRYFSTADGNPISLEFDVPKDKMAGLKGSKQLVVYETLRLHGSNGEIIATHHDSNSEAQTVDVEGPKPTLETRAHAGANGFVSREGGTITDTVTYKNLDTEKYYVVTGKLMLQGTGKEAGITSKSERFKPESPNGSIDVTFEVTSENAQKYESQKLVVFEYLHQGDENGPIVAEHSDISDSYQTVDVEGPAPYLKTEAEGALGNKVVPGDVESVITDTVTYGNVDTNKTYWIIGELVYKENGESTGITGKAKLEPESSSGKAQVTFKVPAGFAKVNRGKKLVVFEELRESQETGKVVAEHRNLNDEAQTVTVEKPTPSIETSASGNGSNNSVPRGGGIVTDHVTYRNLEVGQSYVLKGELVVKPNGAATPIKAEKTFTAKTATGFVDVDFIVTGEQAKEFLGKELVVFETLELNDGTVVAEHRDINASAQTVSVEGPGPRIETLARKQGSKQWDKTVPNINGVAEDRIAIYNIAEPGWYTLKAQLRVAKEHKDDPDYLPESGRRILDTRIKTVWLNKSDGDKPQYKWHSALDVPNTVGGHTLVVYEYLYKGRNNTSDRNLVAWHDAVDDVNQQVTVEEAIKIGTLAYDGSGDEKDKTISFKGGVVADKVTYENLQPGTEYTLEATLMLENGETTGITKTESFTTGTRPEDKNGDVTVNLVITPDNAALLAGKKVVVYERLYLGSDTSTAPVATHEDLNAPAQAVYVEKIPAIKTSAAAKGTNDVRYISQDGGVIVDTIRYQNLVKGATYFVKGTLMDRGSKEADKSTSITSEGTFVAENVSGTWELEFEVGPGMAGKELVVFEELYEGTSAKEEAIAVHKDLNDSLQTVHIAKIGTSAKAGANDGSFNGKVIPFDGGFIRDTVTFENLKPETQYRLVGVLMNKETGQPAQAGGLNLPTVERTFISSPSGNGNTTVDFQISFGQARALNGAELVVFEKLFLGDKEVASHEDISDAGQTVKVENSPELKTRAVNAGDKDLPLPYDGGTITDTVEYKNLRADTDYVIQGELYDKVTNSATGIVSEEKSFNTKKKVNGTVDVDFVVIGDGFAGKKLVVFEKLFEVRNGKKVLVAEHADINDDDQTVLVAKKPFIATKAVKKGSTTNVIDAGGGTVEDIVGYQNLIGGQKYTLTGVLYNKTDAVLTEFVGKTSFTADESGNGEVKVYFTIPSGNDGKTFVVFETLRKGDENGKVVATHQEKDDADQTVTVDIPKKSNEPWIRTFASGDGGRKYISHDGGTVVDHVVFGGLEGNTTYTIAGELYKRVQNGSEFTGEATGIKGRNTIDSQENLTFDTDATGEGSVTLEFNVDESFAGETLVVYEYLYKGSSATGDVIAEHAQAGAISQTVFIEGKPAIKTYASVDANGEKVVVPFNAKTVDDKVAYFNLEKDTDYFLAGSLRHLDGTPVLIAGKEVTGTTQFTTDSAGSDGFVTVTFPIDESLAGGEYVVYQNLFKGTNSDGPLVVSHEDKASISQQFTVESQPKISTIAVYNENKDSGILKAEGGKILDIVGYSGLQKNTCYTLKGVVKDKQLRADAKGIAPVETELCTTDVTSGTVDVEFDVPAGFAGKELVVFEYLYSKKGEVLAAHADYRFTEQTVTVPAEQSLKTIASDAADDDDVISFKGGTITDTVSYTNLDTNKTYVLAGNLQIRGEDGSAIPTGIESTSLPFTPEAANGTVKMTFDVPAELAGKTLVVFEYLYEGNQVAGEPVLQHTDINDVEQTVRVEETPEILTEAFNEARKKEPIAATGGKVVDVVTYKNLKPGSTYTLVGKLLDKTRGQAIGVTATKTFVPDAAHGSVEVVFEVPAGHAGKTLVVFETLRFGSVSGEVVATHENLNDDKQRISVDEAPTLKTVAVNKADGTKTVPATGGTVVDTVSYDHLKPGEKYTVVGELFNKTKNELSGITAEKTFTPNSAKGTVENEFAVPEGEESNVFVVFETLHLGGADGRIVATHHDSGDLDQTVIRDIPTGPGPFIRTAARDEVSGKQTLEAKGGVIVDTVTYNNLVKGENYVLSGVLVDQATGTPTDIVGTATFEAKETKGTQAVRFVVPEFAFAGKTLVAYERLYQGTEITESSQPVAEHVNRYDPEQTVIVGEAPSIFTSAVNPDTQDQIVPSEGGPVVDTVSFTNLSPFTQYTLKGTLMIKETNGSTGETVAKPTSITETDTFMAYTRDGFHKLGFYVPDEFAGQELVVYEELYLGDKAEGTVIAEHKDINDRAQTVTVKAKRAELDTTAVDKESNSQKMGFQGGEIVDTVNYFNLVKDEWYTVAGELMDKETEKTTEIFGMLPFQAEASNGSVKVNFVVPQGYDGKTLVVFERLYKGKPDANGRPQGQPIAEHSNLNDYKQMVSVDFAPKLWTDAQDQNDGDRKLGSNGGTIIDHVSYANLRVGNTYTVKGKLVEKIVDQVTGEITQKDTGIEGEKTFKPSEANGVVEVEFRVPGQWRGSTLVAFEYLYAAGEVEVGKELATHTQIEAESQTVEVEKPTLKTTAVDAVDGDKVIPSTGGQITDNVVYTNLVPEVEYTIAGELMDKETGEGTGLTASVTFIADVSDGMKALTFDVPGSMAGKTLVAFERLYLGKDTSEGKEIAVHADIKDAQQTVRVETPVSIRTSATDQRDGDKLIEDKESNTVVDTVVYRGLTPGQQYTVTGVIVDKTTGQPTSITGETVFVPDSANGEVKIQFIWPTDDKYKRGEFVAFERLYAGRDTSAAPLAVHEDINDFAQSFSVAIPQTKPQQPGPPGSSGEAGSSNAWMLLPVGVVALIAGGAMLAAGSGSSFTVEQKNVEIYPVPAPETIPKQNVILAVTGADVLPYTLLGMVLLTLGGIAFFLRRRHN